MIQPQAHEGSMAFPKTNDGDSLANHTASDCLGSAHGSHRRLIRRAQRGELLFIIGLARVRRADGKANDVELAPAAVGSSVGARKSRGAGRSLPDLLKWPSRDAWDSTDAGGATRLAGVLAIAPLATQKPQTAPVISTFTSSFQRSWMSPFDSAELWNPKIRESGPFRVLDNPRWFWCIWGFSRVSRLYIHRRIVVRTFTNPGAFPAIPQATTDGQQCLS